MSDSAVADEQQPKLQETSLKITEIFYSLQGESLSSGLPTTFIRLTGCPLRCSYCDTAYAFSGGEWMTVATILEQVSSFPTRYVTVTGGEPLAQSRVHGLLRALCDQDYKVSLETSGERDISPVDPRVIRVMDLKTPGSKEVHRNRLENIGSLRGADQVKFVIGSREDYLWSLDMIRQYQLEQICPLLLSPVHGVIDPADIAKWMLEDGLVARLQLQLHKALWGDQPGR